MAAMKRWRTQRLKAASLLESLAAMVIITGSFAGGMIIYLNVVGSNRLDARLVAERIIDLEINQGAFLQEEMHSGMPTDLGLELTVDSGNYNGAVNLRTVQYTVTNKLGKKLAERQLIHYRPHAED